MNTLIVGSPHTGKSLLAENISMEQAGSSVKYYIATMIPYGEAGLQRVDKHRKMRAGKGFITLEWADNIEKRLTDVDFKKSTVLLECMSNLIGNEMHSEENQNLDSFHLTTKIVDAVRLLGDKAQNLVVVTNEFPIDDEEYDADTKAYVRLVATVNERLISWADEVYTYDGEWHRDNVKENSNHGTD